MPGVVRPKLKESPVLGSNRPTPTARRPKSHVRRASASASKNESRNAIPSDSSGMKTSTTTEVNSTPSSSATETTSGALNKARGSSRLHAQSVPGSGWSPLSPEPGDRAHPPLPPHPARWNGRQTGGEKPGAGRTGGSLRTPDPAHEPPPAGSGRLTRRAVQPNSRRPLRQAAIAMIRGQYPSNLPPHRNHQPVPNRQDGRLKALIRSHPLVEAVNVHRQPPEPLWIEHFAAPQSVVGH